MKKVNNYIEFINEEFFKKMFNKKTKSSPRSRIESCVDNILSFLKENDIKDWNDFMIMSTFDRDIVNKIIDHEVKNFKELKEVNFLIRLELSDSQQLREYKDELESLEEYEKCAKIVKRLKYNK